MVSSFDLTICLFVYISYIDYKTVRKMYSEKGACQSESLFDALASIRVQPAKKRSMNKKDPPQG